MASIADMLVGSALENSTKVPDYAGSLQKGVQLGLQIQEVKLNRQKLEQTKAENSLQKYSKVTDLIKIAHESKDPAIANSLWKHAIPKTVKALGADDAFTDEFLETAAKSPETREKVLGYQLEIQNRLNNLQPGDSPAAAVSEIIATISDPAARASLDTDRIVKALEVKAGEEQMNKRNQVTADAALGKQIQAQQETGNVEVRKKTGDAYSTWKNGGGASAREKTREIFNKAIKKLSNNEVVFGTKFKNIPWVGNPEKLPIADKAAKAFLDDIRGGISIKEKTGDPNPTQTQIDSIMSRVIDPRLDNFQNIEKLKTELNAMDADTKDKLNSFVQQGFMKPEEMSVKKTKGPAATFNVGGTEMSADQAKAFYKKFPQFKPDDKTKKALGL